MNSMSDTVLVGRAVLGDRMTDIPFAVPQYSPVDW